MTLDNSAMPPIPVAGERGPQVCATVRLYLAVLDDVPPRQAEAILKHVNTCRDCSREYRLLNQATYLVARLPDTAPSARVDQAVLAAIIARRSSVSLREAEPASEREGEPVYAAPVIPPRRLPARRPRWLVGLAVAATLLLALLTGTHLLALPGTPTAQAFMLPQTVSWNGYVLYHRETHTDSNGKRYYIDTYHDVSSGRMHVETTMGDQLDVVAVGDNHKMLGLDMMHHVAQWDADVWGVDDSAFDLATLRRDLQAKRAVYLGKGHFGSVEVYRIRCRNGEVLLLDMHYRPVNVLANAPGTGTPMYNMVKLLPDSQVPSDMWDMNMPSGFHMGKLPAKP
ncbi:MAG: hypothetical protein H0W02_05980 [Ktedonobacteraceae bacterium]|nr:hypothetical protein [Ktedonobacteraceae bacterium]